jgi:hypothetical protein
LFGENRIQEVITGKPVVQQLAIRFHGGQTE